MGPPANGNGGISIPQHESSLGNGGNSDEQPWTNGGRSPPRAQHGNSADNGAPPPRRSSRSRSPGAPRDGGRGDVAGNPGNNLHVSGLSHKVDTRELEQAFAKVGRVKKAQVMYDPHTRDSRGFGFVTMESAEEADAAITALNGTDLMGKPLIVEKARRGRARTPTPGRYYGPPKRVDRRTILDHTTVGTLADMEEEEEAVVEATTTTDAVQVATTMTTEAADATMIGIGTMTEDTTVDMIAAEDTTIGATKGDRSRFSCHVSSSIECIYARCEVSLIAL
ncbi:hypothetical protein NLI96_g6505 [Meripilus lineatus]|uniref:RRM domain-containing protein n=1 Tax=Meripilus lineatus TaxID=2056292 RepID=A0AAD5V2L0_9APHY|nr:hypothetical protein NLI96_g6505 [Physisporinus lineatus]